jgi:hypothetical protein
MSARRAARIDANQPEIVAALRGVGASVQPIHTLGQGVPDILVGWQGRNYLLEAKQGRGKLTEDEAEWHVLWRGQVAVVRSVDDALAVIGAIEEVSR